MSRAKDILIAVLIVAVVYLLVTREDSKIVAGVSPLPDTSIAVLPFSNMTGDADSEYFSDGVFDEILTELARTPELRVVSRGSVVVFKGSRDKISTIGEALGVSYVVEGAVRKAGTKRMITVQLLRVDTDVHVWVKSYESEAGSMESVSSEIAKSVAIEVKKSQLGSSGRRLP